MPRRAVWMPVLLMGLALVVPGCGKSESGSQAAPATPSSPSTPSGEKGPVVPAATDFGTPEQVKAGPTAPAPKAAPNEPKPLTIPTPVSLKDVPSVIDLRKFPTLEGSTSIEKKLASVHYAVAKGNVRKTADFYTKELTALGWTAIADPKLNVVAEGGAQMFFTKSGYTLYASIGVSPNDGEMNTVLFNLGNIDARALPLIAGAEVTNATPARVIYETKATPDAVKEFMRTEMKKLGWQEYGRPKFKGEKDAPDNTEQKFVNRAVSIEMTITSQVGNTQVFCSVHLLNEQLPILKDAIDVEYGEGPIEKLTYRTPSGTEEVQTFYRREMTDLGWKERNSDKGEKLAGKIVFEAFEKAPIQVEFLRVKDFTVVQVIKVPGGK